MKVGDGDGIYQGNAYCDSKASPKKSPGWEGNQWYRMTVAAGTRIPEQAPGLNRCGTQGTGWLNGAHPTSKGDTVDDAEFCFDTGDDDCEDTQQGKITNCGDYYVYYLKSAPYCNYGYCVTN